jgi:hypothetical protein
VGRPSRKEAKSPPKVGAVVLLPPWEPNWTNGSCWKSDALENEQGRPTVAGE